MLIAEKIRSDSSSNTRRDLLRLSKRPIYSFRRKYEIQKVLLANQNLRILAGRLPDSEKGQRKRKNPIPTSPTMQSATTISNTRKG